MQECMIKIAQVIQYARCALGKIYVYHTDASAFSCNINLFIITFADLLVAEFVEWPALISGRLHCLYRLAQTLSRVVHELVKQGDLSQTNVLLS